MCPLLIYVHYQKQPQHNATILYGHPTPIQKRFSTITPSQTRTDKTIYATDTTDNHPVVSHIQTIIYDQWLTPLIYYLHLEKHPHSHHHLLIFDPHLPENYPHFHYFRWIHYCHSNCYWNYFLLLTYVLRLLFRRYQERGRN